MSGGLQKLWKRRCIAREGKVGMYKGIEKSSLLCGSEALGLNVIEAVEMNCLRKNCGVRRIDRVRN